MEEKKKRSIPETEIHKLEKEEKEAVLIPKVGEIIRGTKNEIREVLGMQNPGNSLNVENMSKEDLLKEVAEKQEKEIKQNPLGLQ